MSDSPDEKFISPDGPLPLAEAAPHLTGGAEREASAGAGQEGEPQWQEYVPAPAERVHIKTSVIPEDKWPHEWHSLCWMMASGSSQSIAARELGGGYTPQHISNVMQRPDVLAKIKQIRAEYWGKNLEQRFQNAAPKAMDFMESVVLGRESNAKIGERLDASRWILEKATGKPESRSEKDSGQTVLHILQALDSLKQTVTPPTEQQRDVLEIAAGTPKEADWMDTWVSNNKAETKETK